MDTASEHENNARYGKPGLSGAVGHLVAWAVALGEAVRLSPTTYLEQPRQPCQESPRKAIECPIAYRAPGGVLLQALTEFVEIWERWLGKSIPKEVAAEIAHREEPLKPFYEHLQKKLDELRGRLAKGDA